MTGLNFARAGKLSGPVPETVTMTETGLSFAADLDFDEWQRLGATLDRIERSVQWWFGDWLNFGERKYGESYTQAAEITPAAYSTLTTYASVAAKVSPERRREGLSWAHHREVAGLDPSDQDRWLDAAETEGWSTRELERNIRDTPDGDSPPVREPLREVPSLPDVTEHGAGRVEWQIGVSVPDTSDLVAVVEAVERSARALEVILTELQADPAVTVGTVTTVLEDTA